MLRSLELCPVGVASFSRFTNVDACLIRIENKSYDSHRQVIEHDSVSTFIFGTTCCIRVCSLTMFLMLVPIPFISIAIYVVIFSIAISLIIDPATFIARTI